jgi:hypothetical protein
MGKNKPSPGYTPPNIPVGTEVKFRIAGAERVGTVEEIRGDGKLTLRDHTTDRTYVRSPLLVDVPA